MDKKHKKSSNSTDDTSIETSILIIRGKSVMLDHDLAALYEVATKALNQAVKRNLDRFPDDFLFRLTAEETRELNRSQSVTGSQKHRDPRYPPYAFTEQGVGMLSGVLSSERAIQVHVAIVRTFVRLRTLGAHGRQLEELARRVRAIERHDAEQDRHIVAILEAIQRLSEPPPRPRRRRIGFLVESDGEE